MQAMDRTSYDNTSYGSSAKKASASDWLPANLGALLRRLDRELWVLYGKERYGGLILYGSYARGEANEGSDVDLLVLLEGEVDPVRELIRMEDVKWPLALESGYALSVLAVGAEAYHSSEEPFLWSVRTEGIPAA
jgi:predicted nucleotidyltransferase